MTVLITTCFVSVVGGYVNAAQITKVQQAGYSSKPSTFVYTSDANDYAITGDKHPADFMRRVQETCEAKVEQTNIEDKK